MARSVCVLSEVQAESYEQTGKVPDCDFHEHVTHSLADFMVAARNDRKEYPEGDGSARTVISNDGRRRITAIARILRYVSIPNSHSPFGIGMTSMQAVQENLR